jgi:hemin uptake protein HemP
MGVQILRGKISDFLAEGPAVSCDVRGGVLPLPVRMVRRSTQDVRTMGSRMIMVGIHVIDLDHDGKAAHLARFRNGAAIVGIMVSDNHDSVTERKPSAVSTRSPQLGEAERVAQPVDRCLDV